MAHQILEDRVLLGGQLDGFAVARHCATAGIEHEAVDLERRRRDRLGTAAQRFHAGQQFLECERLGDVVVGPHAQRLDLEVDRILRGQHQDRQSIAAVAQRAEDVDAGELGKAEIEHHDVVIAAAAARAPQAFVPIADQIHVIAGLIEAAPHVFADRFVVFDDEDFHPIGRNTLKFVPTPICDSTSMRPRCSSTMP